MNCLPWPKTCFHPACSVRRGAMSCRCIVPCCWHVPLSLCRQMRSVVGIPCRSRSPAPHPVRCRHPATRHTRILKGCQFIQPAQALSGLQFVRMWQPTMLRMWRCVLTTCLESYTCTAELFDSSACCVVPPTPRLGPRVVFGRQDPVPPAVAHLAGAALQQQDAEGQQ